MDYVNSVVFWGGLGSQIGQIHDVLGGLGVATLRVRPRIGNKLVRFVMFKEIWGRYAPGTTADWSQIGLKPS